MYQYQHGGDIYACQAAGEGRAVIDFSANINPLGMPAGVKKALKDAVGKCVNYPDPFCRRLQQEAAGFLGLPEAYFFFGNGAADVLFRLALALKPKKALLLAPTFSDYEKSLRAIGCKTVYYNLKESCEFMVQPDILKKITPSVDMVYICNPNNPTGQLTNRELLNDILAKCREVQARLVVDECFMDFVAAEKAFSMRDLLADYPELIILKAFTKTFAIPGVRLGYCLSADEHLHSLLHEHGQDWSVSVLAQAAGTAALQETAYLHESMALISEERDFLCKRLRSVGAKIYGSEANYIFFRLERPRNLPELLAEQGFLIRSCANYRNLEGPYYRVAVKTRVLNRALIKAIKEAKKHAFFTFID